MTNAEIRQHVHFVHHCSTCRQMAYLRPGVVSSSQALCRLFQTSSDKAAFCLDVDKDFWQQTGMLAGRAYMTLCKDQCMTLTCTDSVSL